MGEKWRPLRADSGQVEVLGVSPGSRPGLSRPPRLFLLCASTFGVAGTSPATTPVCGTAVVSSVLWSSETGGGPARCGARPPSRISRPVSRVLCGAGRSPTRDGHSSGTPVARRFEQPTRTAGSGQRSWNTSAAGATLAFHTVPIRFCSRWGLPCRLRCRKRGALLPHRFTLTAAPPPYPPPLAGEGKGWGRPRRSVLCGTIPRVAPAGRYPAPHVHGARTFLPGPSLPPRERGGKEGQGGRPAD
jgi:hypothetical protein